MKKLSTINRNDLLLCTGLLLAALCIWCAIFFVQRNGSRDGLMVVVTVDGEEYYSGLLAGENQQAERREIDIDGHNKVVITDGEVWMEEADCPDRLGVSPGKISRSGQTIIWLPNKTMGTIKGGKSEYAWQQPRYHYKALYVAHHDCHRGEHAAEGDAACAMWTIIFGRFSVTIITFRPLITFRLSVSCRSRFLSIIVQRRHTRS